MSEEPIQGASTPKHYTLQVQRAENVNWKSKHHRGTRRFYVEVQADNFVQRSESARMQVPVQYEWDETLPLSACANETHVCIKLKHKSTYKRDPCIGYIEGDLADVLDGDESVSRRKGPFEPSPVAATLFLKLENSDAKSSTKAALRNLQSSLTDRNQPDRQSFGAHAAQTLDQDFEQEPDAVNSDVVQAIRRIVPNIDKTAAVMAGVLDISMMLGS